MEKKGHIAGYQGAGSCGKDKYNGTLLSTSLEHKKQQQHSKKEKGKKKKKKRKQRNKQTTNTPILARA